MRMVKRWDFVPKEGKVPLFSIADMVKRKEGEAWDETYPVEVMTIRNKDGLYTKAYHQLLLDMGFPLQRDVEKWCVCCIQIAVTAIVRSLDFPWDPLYSWESKAGKSCHPQNAFCINLTPFLAR